MDLILADDSVIIREGLTRLLTDAGHHIAGAVNCNDLIRSAFGR